VRFFRFIRKARLLLYAFCFSVNSRIDLVDALFFGMLFSRYSARFVNASQLPVIAVGGKWGRFFAKSFVAKKYR